MQRVYDFTLASIALFVLLPMLICIGLLIAFLNPGPVLFTQQRVGQNGKAFTMVKFRTLGRNGVPTRLGAMLRRYSLDELPEFWNVIRGDMALVGPRPMIASEQPKLARVRALRQRIRPGITGWAQINGRNALTFEETFRLDLWYLRNRTGLLNLYILWATVPCVLNGRGACALAPKSRPKTRAGRKHVDATV
ncbi:MAG: sugar transferase [Pseudomonadota bacterium]